MAIEITAVIHDIRGNRHGDLSDLVQVGMGYKSSGIIGELRVDFPIEQARWFWIGQRVRLIIEPEKLRGQPSPPPAASTPPPLA